MEQKVLKGTLKSRYCYGMQFLLTLNQIEAKYCYFHVERFPEALNPFKAILQQNIRRKMNILYNFIKTHKRKLSK